ncbi:MAG: hypothetical protein AAGH89_14030, partial [Verrucomicrobiota bacterium]
NAAQVAKMEAEKEMMQAKAEAELAEFKAELEMRKQEAEALKANPELLKVLQLQALQGLSSGGATVMIGLDGESLRDATKL